MDDLKRKYSLMVDLSIFISNKNIIKWSYNLTLQKGRVHYCGKVLNLMLSSNGSCGTNVQTILANEQRV